MSEGRIKLTGAFLFRASRNASLNALFRPLLLSSDRKWAPFRIAIVRTNLSALTTVILRTPGTRPNVSSTSTSIALDNRLLFAMLSEGARRAFDSLRTFAGMIACTASASGRSSFKR